MELLQLRYFFESAKNGSFAKTAEKHMVPTSSVSASVKRLEQELGCKLFDRTCNRIKVNANGDKLYKTLGMIFPELDTAIRSLTNPDEDLREIRMLVRSVRKIITNRILDYSSKNPKTSFKTTFDLTETNLDGYDIIIDEKKEGYSHMECFPLCKRTIRLKVGEGSPLLGKKLSLRDLKSMAFISYGEQSNTHKILVDACKNAGFVPNIVVQCNDIDCHEKLVKEGLGIGIGFEDDSKGAERKLFLDVGDFCREYNVYCFYKNSAYYGNIKHFADYLKETSL